MHKLTQWYNPAKQPTCGVLSLTKAIDKAYQDLLHGGLADVQWRHHEKAHALSLLTPYLGTPNDMDEQGQRDIAVSSFLANYIGTSPTLEQLHGLVERFVGWLPEFKQGIPFKAWNGTTAVWAVLFAHSIKHSAKAMDQYVMSCNVIKGPATGFSIDKLFHSDSSKRLYRELCGYRFDEITEAPSPMFLGGMYFIACIDVTDNRLRLGNAFATSTQRDFNKKLMDRRRNMCLGGFERNRKCFPYCPLGRESCILATHAHDYYVGLCNNYTPRHQGYIVSNGWCSKCLREGYAASRSMQEKEERVVEYVQRKG